MNLLNGLLSKLQGGHETTAADVKVIAVRHRAFVSLIEGWLFKKGDLNTNWQKRYFMLCAPRTIFYFENVEKANRFKQTPCSDNETCVRMAKGSVALTDNCVLTKRGTLDGKTHCFSVKAHSNSEREFVMSADSDAECDKWLAALRSSEEYGKAKSSGSPTNAAAGGGVAALTMVAASGAVPTLAVASPVASPTFSSSSSSSAVVVVQPSQSMMTVVMQPMQPSQPMSPQMVMVVQEPQPETVVVNGLTVPASLATLDSNEIRSLISMFEGIQQQNRLQIQAIYTRLTSLIPNPN